MKIKFLCVALIGVLFFSSCNNDERLGEPVVITSQVPGELSSNNNICVDMYLPSLDGQTQLRGASLKAKRWVTGQTIRIKFLNGDTFLQNKVKTFAAQWLEFANLKFQYVDVSENADVKIRFDNSNSSWSYIGIDCKYISQTEPSMNFGWFTSTTSNNEFSRTIIHEFGHVLGLIHEHQSPAANIPWNRSAVYSFYGGAPNYWTTTQVDLNIFNKYSTTQTNYTAFDSQSIMLYPISSSLTTNGFSVGMNSLLSPMDKTFASQIYPFPSANNLSVLYRYLYLGHHFYTTNYQELQYNYLESILGHVYKTKLTGTLPINRYRNTITGNRLSTLNFAELGYGGTAGWVYEGITGYAYPTKQAGTIPVFRYRSGSDHFYTIDPAENRIRLRYVFELIAFYILP